MLLVPGSVTMSTMKLNSKKMLLIDGIGAVVSCCFLGILLPKFSKSVGMPVEQLYFLATIALFFAIFSLTSFLKVKNEWFKFLKWVAVANLLYSLMTAGLVFVNFEDLGYLGKIYFLAEIPIVFILAIIEWKIGSRQN